ncbi:MAG: CsgG/HfaB family protein [Candidatus Marinimicrobia bacterium]|nr:CsgG/HfaB family protein [Candidatus Neomarinimicrobiota bacterium]MDP6853837.1 CsgG/HfaB family protein [Candidatus Neomarinimicrobiota bacterium]MDP6936859.1 CsgG/HfaB family protein [Candidatus Neomarinimicrobiota bacterium]
MQLYLVIIFTILGLIYSRENSSELTLERKPLIILDNQENTSEIGKQLSQMVSGVAIRLNRYEVIDRNQLTEILTEQKFQTSGAVNESQAVEIGNIAGAKEALFIQINNFGQKGVPTKEQKEKQDKEEPEKGLFGWVVKEVVKAKIDKDLEDVERYPNNIHTVIDGEIRLLDIETGKAISSFVIAADYTGGIKSKSLSEAMKIVRHQVTSNLKSMYQLKTEILSINGDEVILLLGEDLGVEEGSYFQVSTLNQKKTIRDREITLPGKDVGLIQINEVGPDASHGKIIRKWNTIEPGCKAQELPSGVFAWGLSGSYGRTPTNIKLNMNGMLNPLSNFGGSIYAGLGIAVDSRDDTDFQLGLGGDTIFRFLRTSPFSMGVLLNLPFEFHFRSDDANPSHSVSLAVFSPRIGLQSEFMITPTMDVVVRGEYIFSSYELGGWTYSEDSSDNEDSENLDAVWVGDTPSLNYSGIQFSVGFRSIEF